MHLHIGLIKALTTFAEVIIIGFFWRLASMYFHNTAWGQAMGFVY